MLGPKKLHPILKERVWGGERLLSLLGKEITPGRKIVAVVGAGHVPGIKAHWNNSADLKPLETLPPKGRGVGLIKWGLPVIMVALVMGGFIYGGTQAGTDMLKWWIIANGTLGRGMHAGLPGHSFVLIDADGVQRWYGEYPSMWLAPEDLFDEVRQRLDG